MKTGNINNCEKCLSSYGQYGGKNPDQYEEYWCMISKTEHHEDIGRNLIQPPKGVCQFCNPTSEYYLGNNNL